ncbi:MAG: EAL domain-containing protein [Actinomycetota bacterium]|nr:EAL domain-containing protein [Actinomycetota bacterium]
MTVSRPDPRSAGRRPEPLTLLVAAVVGAAVACLAAGLLDGSHARPPEPWRALLVLLAFGVGDLAVLHLPFGRDRYTVTLSEASMVVGLVLVPWPWLPLLAALGIGAAHLLRRRSGPKVVFNTASAVVGAVLAELVLAGLGDGQPVQGVLSVRDGLALVAAVFVYALWNSVTVSGAISLSAGLPFRDVVRRGLPLKLAVLAGNTGIALLLLTTPWQGSTPVLVVSCTVLLYLSYRGYLRALEERDVWRQLDETAKALSRLDEREVAAAAVDRAALLFGPETVELALARPDGTGLVLRQGPDGRLQEHAEPDVARRLPTERAVHLHHVAGARVGWMVAPLTGLDTTLGVLRLGFPGLVASPGRDLQVLSTFAHGLSTSLQNARLYEEMRQQAEHSAHEARHDPLTGLPNRTLLHQRAGDGISHAARTGTCFALLLLDLDHFKQINDTLGHSAGDQVLRTVGQRLSGATRAGDTVARLGGDEFAVLLTGLPDRAVADTVARDLLRALNEPMTNEGLRLVVEGSIGVACYPGDGDAEEELFRRADVALYQAKQSRGSVAHYRQDRDASDVDRLTLVGELRQGMLRGELVLHFQPQVDIATRTVVGAEVLARWQHPTRGLLGPGEFVQVAEQSGLVREFTLHVLDGAVRECAGWTTTGLGLHIAVNLSARNLLDPALPDDVARILDRHGLPASRLVLEITETTMMSELDVVEEVLAGLRRLGVQLSVDDFGTGYSSMSFLQRVAVNEIKIDRTFVSRMLDEPGDGAIVRATVQLVPLALAGGPFRAENRAAAVG